MDYGDVIYDQPLNESLSNRNKISQIKHSNSINGTIKGSSREKNMSVRV